MANQPSLSTTVERIRGSSYPALPKELVQKIIEIQTDNLDDQAAAFRRIDDAINEYLSTGGV